MSQAERNKFNHWLVPTPETKSHVGLGVRLSTWVKAAAGFVIGDNADLRQQVIERISTEGGFARVAEVLHTAPSTTVDIERGRQYLRDFAQPLLSLLSCAEVAKSLLLQPAVDRVHNLLYGTGGQRALAFFTTLCDVIGTQENDFESLIDTVADALTVLHSVVELNGGAKVIEGYLEVVDKFKTILSHTEIAQSAKVIKATDMLRKIAGIMQVGLSLPEVQAVGGPATQQLAVFELTRELPGQLRDQGPRHDNDHVHIADIAIMPTKNELEAHETDYLPVNDPRYLHLSGLERLVDRHFRLLREDSVGQLRDAVRFELHQLRRAFGLQTLAPQEQRGTRVMVYQGVNLDAFALGKDHLAIQTSFHQPESLSRKSKAERQTWWESSRSLMEDSLVCLLGPDGFAAFASICHNPKKTQVFQAQRCSKDLFEDALRATTFVKLVEPQSFL